VLWPLLFGNFVIGTGVMVVPGTLNDISSALDVSVALNTSAMRWWAARQQMTLRF